MSNMSKKKKKQLRERRYRGLWVAMGMIMSAQLIIDASVYAGWRGCLVAIVYVVAVVVGAVLRGTP